MTRARETLVALSVMVAAAAAVEAADLVFRSTAGVTPLSEPAKQAVTDVVQRLTSRCGIDSLDQPQVFPTRDGAAAWRAAEQRPHIYLRYPAPYSIRVSQDRTVLASEALVGVDDPRFFGPIMTRHAGAVLMLAKCDGGVSIELACQPELAPQLPSAYARNCSVPRR